MRVIYFSKDYTTHDHRYLEKLSRSSHEVWYLRLEKGVLALEERPVPPGIRRVEWRGGKKPLRSVPEALRLLPDLVRVLRQIRPDLVHAGPVPSCGFLTALTGFRPFLVMSWGSDLLLEADETPWKRWIIRFALSRADGLIGDSQVVREKARQLGGLPDERIVTYPWGIDLGLFRPGETALRLRQTLGWQGNPVILSTRSWEPLYGIPTLLNAFEKLLKRHPEVRLILMGNGSQAAQIHPWIEEKNLSSKIHLTGQVPHQQLVDYFRTADLYVSCTLSDGTSISLLEAMACGLPAVVTDIPGNREWVKPDVNGWLFPAGDDERLKETLEEALRQQDRWSAIGQANLGLARQRADWDKNFEVLMQAYRNLAEGKEALLS